MNRFFACVLISLFLFSSLALEAAEKKNLTIITSFYPVYIHTLNITRDVPGLRVLNLVSPSVGCLHDYELTTEDMKTLSKGDLFITNGAGMEGFLGRVTSQMKRLKIIDSGKGIELLKDGKSLNAHLWLSPANALAQVHTITGALEEADPSHRELYKKNEALYTAQLQNLSKSMHEELKNLSHKDFISFHRAFDYLAQEFGLKVVAVIRNEPSAEPSAREIAGIITLVKKNKVRTIFVEPQYPRATAESIARETGARVFTLDTAVSGPIERDAYIKIMKKNCSTLKEALK